MPDQNENMQKSNEEPREDQRRRAELSPETPEFGPPPGENEGMPDGNFPEVEFPDMEFPFIPGENPDYPLPTPSLPSMPPSGGGNGGRPNRPTTERPESTEQTGRISWGTVAVDRGVSDSGLPGKYAGRLKQPSLLLYHPFFECGGGI